MKNQFQFILDNYLKTNKIASKSNPCYDIITKDMPNSLRKILGQPDKLHIYGRMGMGNATNVPWVAILNKDISVSAEYGLYIVYLFKKDMSGFYLSLNQGITNFKRSYSNDPYAAATKVADYFRSQLTDTKFSKMPINLGVRKTELAYGYEKSNIISKYYESNKFTYESLKNDLVILTKEYDDLIKNINDFNYDTIIKNIMGHEEPRLISGSEAVQTIKETLEEEGFSQGDVDKTLLEVEPFVDRTEKFSRITNPVLRKIDYIKKAKSDAINGAQGEELAITFEKQRLINCGRPDLAEKIKWDSKINDTLGYDIVSYIIDKNGNEQEIKIEVKTTETKKDCKFFISKNEVETSIKFGKQYCLFRIYDLKSRTPKFYRIFGPIEENFDLDPISFMASPKKKK